MLVGTNAIDTVVMSQEILRHPLKFLSLKGTVLFVFQAHGAILEHNQVTMLTLDSI